MSLTLAHAPLAGHPAETNYTIDGPAHRILFEPFPRRLRAELAGEVVFDTRRAHLLHETGLMPQVYVPLEDVRAELLVPSDHGTHCPFKGDATYRSVVVGDRVSENALWLYEDPIEGAEWLRGFAGTYFGRFDRWLDEDEETIGNHIRDPYHRIDVRATSQPVTVRAGDEVVARSTRALVLSETGLPNRWYLPREDVRAELRPGDRKTVCAYKGHATYWSLDGVENAAWSYEDPFEDVARIRGRIAFEPDQVEIELG
jgi:uncharacterized protein (DUF427 family)